jgi:hypothetical protein
MDKMQFAIFSSGIAMSFRRKNVLGLHLPQEDFLLKE